jgi:hypothetical protein
MPSLRLAFVVHKPVDLTIESATPLDWHFVDCDQHGLITSGLGHAIQAGVQTRSLLPGLYGVMAPGNGPKVPALTYSFSDAAAGTAVMGNDKDPWPDPPPPPPNHFATNLNGWNALWKGPSSPTGATGGVVKPTTFMAVAGGGPHRPTIRTEIYIW